MKGKIYGAQNIAQECYFTTLKLSMKANNKKRGEKRKTSETPKPGSQVMVMDFIGVQTNHEQHPQPVEESEEIPLDDKTLGRT